jgi:hypothetical protein
MPHYRQRLSALKALLGDQQVYAVGAAIAGMFPRHGRIWNSGNRQQGYDWPCETTSKDDIFGSR